MAVPTMNFQVYLMYILEDIKLQSSHFSIFYYLLVLFFLIMQFSDDVTGRFSSC